MLEESRLAATDPVKQFAISFFDNKFASLIPLKIAYFLDRQDSIGAEDFYVITLKVLFLWIVTMMMPLLPPTANALLAIMHRCPTSSTCSALCALSSLSFLPKISGPARVLPVGFPFLLLLIRRR